VKRRSSKNSVTGPAPQPQRHDAHAGWLSRWPAGVLVGAVAIATRGVHVLESSRLPIFERPTVDAALYVETARRIAQDWILPEVFFKPPLFAYTLGAWWRVVGEDYLWLRVPFLVLGACTAVLTWLLARRLFDARIALVAGLLYAMHRSAVYFETELLEIGLVTFSHTAALLLLLRAGATSSRTGSLVSGTALGVGCVARPTLLLFAIVALVWLGRRRALTALVGVCLGLAPATLHNAWHGRDFVLVSSNLGLNFYIGNNERANGRIASTPELPAEPARARRIARSLAEQAGGQPLRPSQVSRFWLERGAEYAVTHPGRTLSLTARKLFYAWNGAAISDNEDLAALGRYLRVYRVLPVGMWLLAPLGLLGLLAARSPRARDLNLVRVYVVVQLLALLPFFVVERFRLPWAPALAVFTAWTLVELITRFRNSPRGAWKLASASVVLLLLCNMSAFGVRDAPAFDLDYKIAYAYQQQGRIDDALGAYRNAVRNNPRAALARNALGYLLAERGEDLDDAARLVEEALALDPARTANYAESLAFVELRRGNINAAVRACDRGLAAARDPRTRAALLMRRAAAHEAAGEPAQAAQDLKSITDPLPQSESAQKARQRLQQLQQKTQTPERDP
jgi:4-amino-4-deoxy-L-arabinose transferase-like glycosyltransferase